MARIESSDLHSIVIDSRRWSSELAVEESFNELRDKPWTWKAGDTKVHAFTLSFGRRLVRRVPSPAPGSPGQKKLALLAAKAAPEDWARRILRDRLVRWRLSKRPLASTA
jgi:hypothetical protein